LYGNAGAQPDNRDHVEVWRFDDGGSLVYDWQAKTYTIDLPGGTVSIKVGSTEAVLTDDAITAKSGAATVEAASITLTGQVQINGTLRVTGDILGGARIIDTAGNTANHKH
ncbi:phage baseplate assembly protein V, partial [Pseudomonas putida]|uniref:phage baseplate assembly protein V n=2 Tax=Pseudomonas TaxID=286 RepID=UPI0023644BBC